MTLLPGRPGGRDSEHGRHQRFVVYEDVELPSLQQEAEVTDGGIGSKKLSVESGVSNLGRI
jgi:hypothetical protein